VKLDSDSSAATPVKTEAIHTKYRPKRLKDVLGQDAIVKSIQATLKSGAPNHTYLLTGPSGTGKTTLARIIAAEMGCDPATLIEFDAASKSGVDDVREVTASLRYNGFGDNPSKGVIVDECHRLSKQAWDAFLKITEEPPEHVYFFFCSTEPGKVPIAINTRAQGYALKPVRFDALMDLLESVTEAEGFDPIKGLLAAVAEAADGSPRAALTGLAKVHACDDLDEANMLLATIGENTEVIELCRMLCFGNPNWSDVTKCLTSLEDVPAESVRLIVTNYVAAVLAKPKNMKDVPRLLDILQAFSKPCNPSEKNAPLFLAFGKLLYD